MSNRLKRLLVAVALITGLTVPTMVWAPTAQAVRQNVVNEDCAHDRMTLLVKDGSGHRWRIPPQQGLNMKWGGRKIWVPSNSIVYKSTRPAPHSANYCPRKPWAINLGDGYWKSFNWAGPNIEFSVCRNANKKRCPLPKGMYPSV